MSVSAVARRTAVVVGIAVLIGCLTLARVAAAEEPAKAEEAATAEAPANALDLVKATYEEKCAKCHGESGKGDGPKAKTLKKRPRNYTDKEKMAKLTDEKLIAETLDGKKPMPSYRGKLTEAEIADLIAYIRTFAE